MQSRWTDSEAQVFVDRYAAEHGEDVALRVYTSRLIGRDEDLVMHGGGNTSVKTTVADIFGEPVSVVCVKGSGWDLVDIEPAGLPAVELEPLRKLRALGSMTDEDMVCQVRRGLLDVTAPNPSVEALLHAYLPHKFVDHTHADAILIVGNQPDGEQRIREALGDEVAILPWIMPGFPLAKAVAEAYEANPGCNGVVLLNHGIFTFASDARESYEKMVELVDRVEQYAAERAPRDWPPSNETQEARLGRFARVLPSMRGAIASPRGEGAFGRCVADIRTGGDLCAISAREDARELFGSSPLTPNHAMRTKGPYLVVGESEAGDRARLDAAVERYVLDYVAYFEANQRATMRILDPYPRVVVVAGLGLVGFGGDKLAARIAADIAEHTLRGKAQAQELGRYVGLEPDDLFEVEYWSLEQAKHGQNKAPKLAGQIGLVTGAAGAIGHGIADALLSAGAHVLVTDFDADGLERVRGLLAEKHGSACVATFVADVTDASAIDAAFDACTIAFGGVDIVVPNAGIAHVSELRDMDPERFRQVVDVNLGGTMTVLRAAARVFEQQRTGGSVELRCVLSVQGRCPPARQGRRARVRAARRACQHGQRGRGVWR